MKKMNKICRGLIIYIFIVDKCMMFGVIVYFNDVLKNCRFYWKCEGEELKFICCFRGFFFLVLV